MGLETSESVFRLLVDCLQKNKEIHLHIIWGALALQIAVIGWLLSSGSARSFIAANQDARIMGMVVVMLVAAIHFCLLVGTYRESAGLVGKVGHNAYFKSLPDEAAVVVGFWRIDALKAIMRGLFTFSLFGVLFYLIHTCTRPHG